MDLYRVHFTDGTTKEVVADGYFIREKTINFYNIGDTGLPEDEPFIALIEKVVWIKKCANANDF